ncbi:hypothetical protein LWI29_000984 [Acer saccharum]|uniref:Uncharacterized protein n=1 Tax=Acer saccharum TaxID=4024 RepID=A0AA39RUE1_ACESA|nr:hypothetical protein LWI29_000984 [Acer saccharum]
MPLPAVQRILSHMIGQSYRNDMSSLSNATTPAAARSHSSNGPENFCSDRPYLLTPASLSDMGLNSGLPVGTIRHSPTDISLPTNSSSCPAAQFPTDNPTLGSIPSLHPMITSEASKIGLSLPIGLGVFSPYELTTPGNQPPRRLRLEVHIATPDAKARQSTEETPQDHLEDFEGRKQRKGKGVMNE